MKNTTFKELNLSNEMQMAVDSLGFEEATPIQTEAIPHIMAGKDVTGLAQTGTGKTFAFGIPAIEKLDKEVSDVQVLILCPTRELAIQTCEGLKGLTKFMEWVKIIPIYGGQQIDRQFAALKKNPQIVVGTPGRVMDHMKRKTLKLDKITMLVLDEADEMLNMGFREDIDAILEKTKSEKQIILFSATMSKGIMEITSKYQNVDAVKIKVSHSELVAPKIDQFYLEVKEGAKADVLTRLLDSMNIKLSLVFCNTKRKVDEVTAHLQASGYMVEALHGDIKQSQRDNIMKRFRKGDIDILVATDVAARGIDVDDIDVVFNYDIPSDDEYYVHRIGRTGRAGREGKAYTFVLSKEMYKLRDIMKYTKANIVLQKAPSIEVVQEKKVAQKFEKIKEEYAKGNFSKYVGIVEGIVEQEENMTSIDIAAILLKLELEKNEKAISEVSKSLDRPKDRRKDSNDRGDKVLTGDLVRLFVNMGRMDGFDDRKLKSLVTDEMNIPEDSVSGVKTLDKFSFINVAKDYVNTVMEKQSDFEFNGRELNIEVSSTSSENTGVKRNFGGDRKPRSFGEDRRRSFGDKPRSFGEDRSSFGDRKPRSFGDKPRSFGEGRRSSFGDRKPRSFGEDRTDSKPRDFKKAPYAKKDSVRKEGNDSFTKKTEKPARSYNFKKKSEL